MVFSEYSLALFLASYFFLSALFSFLINWLLLKFSFNLGTGKRDESDQKRWSSAVIPATGGISFFILFLISFSVMGAFPRPTDYLFDNHLIGIIASSCLGFVLGLADDAYNTNPLAKFIAQLSCAFILIISDIYIKVSGNPAIDFAITIVWVIGLMNSINMLDNMDAITTTISMCIIMALIAVVTMESASANIFYLLILVGVLGSLSGFLFYNWHPARVYMGDTGSQFLGVFLASISIIFLWNYRDENIKVTIQVKQFVIPMLVFIIPLIDTTTVTLRRLLRKQSPFIGGKDHITHHLVYLGLSEKTVALILISICLGSIALVLSLLLNLISWTTMTTFFCFGYFLIVFIVFQVIYNRGKANLKSV